MKIWVNFHNTFGLFSLNVQKIDNVASVKAAIEATEGIAISNQRCLHYRYALQDRWTLKECGIEEGSVLTLFLHRPAGRIPCLNCIVWGFQTGHDRSPATGIIVVTPEPDPRLLSFTDRFNVLETRIDAGKEAEEAVAAELAAEEARQRRRAEKEAYLKLIQGKSGPDPADDPHLDMRSGGYYSALRRQREMREISCTALAVGATSRLLDLGLIWKDVNPPVVPNTITAGRPLQLRESISFRLRTDTLNALMGDNCISTFTFIVSGGNAIKVSSKVKLTSAGELVTTEKALWSKKSRKWDVTISIKPPNGRWCPGVRYRTEMYGYATPTSGKILFQTGYYVCRGALLPLLPGDTPFTDKSGVFWFIGCQTAPGLSETTRISDENWVNPSSRGLVTMSRSSGRTGDIHAVASPAQHQSCYTLNQADQWFAADLRMYTLKPVAYALRHGYSTGQYMVRNWVFEASNDNATWTVLKEHVNDTSVGDSAFATCRWELDPEVVKDQEFRYYRVRQTGENAKPGSYIFCVSGLELYGYLGV